MDSAKEELNKQKLHEEKTIEKLNKEKGLNHKLHHLLTEEETKVLEFKNEISHTVISEVANFN